ncbi:DUF6705 family protein [Winogradskyella sp.]|uniref:DUF6705 family protein n=1 Tax=Winogradskyella sp. TaxID=1883156 RepID=UPI00263655FE|nr:DUF6705 family protein [Winogradskyella sp.]
MKQIVTIFTLALSLYSCKAQSPLLSLDDQGWNNIDNAYYKDINNVLNDFEGTWLYSNDTISLKISLVKSVQYFNGDYYEDTMVGGYQYIENGIEKINTLTDADNPNLGISASIDGNLIFDNCQYLPVDDCIDSEKYLGLSINDTTSDGHVGWLMLHKRQVNGQEALKINIEMNYYKFDLSSDGEVPAPTLPWQMHDVILIKQ